MKKRYVIIFLLMLFLFPTVIKAQTGTTIKNTNIRTKPSIESDYVLCNDGSKVSISGKVTILETLDENPLSTTDSCTSNKWYKLTGNDYADGITYEGYGCSDLITLDVEGETGNPSTPGVSDTNTVNYYGNLKNDFV